MNAVEIEEAISELPGQFSGTVAEFHYAFLEAFGNKATLIKCLRTGISNKSDLGGILQISNIHILTYDVVVTQMLAVLLKASRVMTKVKAKLFLATDGVNFEGQP